METRWSYDRFICTVVFPILVRIWSSLVKLMACCLFSTKPLPEPMLTYYCQLDFRNTPADHLNIQLPSHQYRDFCYKDKMVAWQSYLYNENPHTWKDDLYIETGPMPQWVKSLWPSDTIWRHKSGSTLDQVMAWCLMAPSHYLNQCWLIISKVQWHSFYQKYVSHQSLKLAWKLLI